MIHTDEARTHASEVSRMLRCCDHRHVLPDAPPVVRGHSARVEMHAWRRATSCSGTLSKIRNAWSKFMTSSPVSLVAGLQVTFQSGAAASFAWQGSTGARELVRLFNYR